MSVYNWETAGNAHHRKKVKKTGTVVLHTDAQVDTAFARLQKEVTVERLHASQKEAEDALANPHAATVKTALMTASTATVLETKMGFDGLLPCQAQCYRGIFNGRDVILHSRTGSGKTLAYALPIIERHLLLERHQPNDAAHGPFLLIFVFSNDLAMQTRSVLMKIYEKQTNLRIAVAGFDDLQPRPASANTAADGEKTKKGKGKKGSGIASVVSSSTTSGSSNETATSMNSGDNNGGAVDILIGTVRTIDEAIRGHKVAAAATAEEEAETARETRLLGRKHPRVGATPSSGAKNNNNNNSNQEESDDDEDAVNASDDDDDNNKTKGNASKSGAAAVREAGVISPARVRAIVVDEVDTTLGPRFSALGRRMKNLLKFVRKANGALAEGLLNDFRAHHYVLCGATIPNWVLKAGFLGVKKYYYQLVAVGTAKLPPQLECFHQPCKQADRVTTAARLLMANQDFNGRVVVFGTPKQLVALEAALQAAGKATLNENESKSSNGNSSSGKKGKKAATAEAPAGTAAGLVVRALTSEKDEAERVAAIEDFNCGVAQILLCTDVAARGLDFTEVDTVLMLNLPRNALAADTFVHRAGRTARVGRAGRCVLLHDSSEDAELDAIAKSTHVVLKALPAAVAATLAAPAASSKAATSSSSSTATTAAKSEVSAAPAETVVTLKLVVRNPFRYTKPQVKVPSAMQIFNANVAEALKAQLTNVQEESGSNGEVVRFSVPASQVHEVKQQLWKYTLQEA